MIQFFIDTFEYFIALGVFAYGVINESVFYVCIAIMLWCILDTLDNWKSKK